MAQFLGDIAGMLEILTFGLGLVVLHHAQAQQSTLLKLAALVMLVGSLGSGICTTYYWVDYQQAGVFSSDAQLGHGHTDSGSAHQLHGPMRAHDGPHHGGSHMPGLEAP
jgi:hypothetical protein